MVVTAPKLHTLRTNVINKHSILVVPTNNTKRKSILHIFRAPTARTDVYKGIINIHPEEEEEEKL